MFALAAIALQDTGVEPNRDARPMPGIVGLAAADVDGDGTDELIAAHEDGRVRITSAENLSELVELQTSGRPTGLALETSGRLPHILVVTREPEQLVVFSPDVAGQFRRTVFPIIGSPSSVTVRTSSERTMKSAMVVATEGEGRDGLEIFESCYGCPCGSSFFPAGNGASMVGAADLDGDGAEEIITVAAGSEDLTVFQRRDGTYVPAHVVSVDANPAAAVVTRVSGKSAVVVATTSRELVIYGFDAESERRPRRIVLPFPISGLIESPQEGVFFVSTQGPEIMLVDLTGDSPVTTVAARASSRPSKLAIFRAGKRPGLAAAVGNRIELLPLD